MSTTQLSFSLRVSSGVKTVHLLGSWDGYAGQLPLSKDRSSSKSGSWKGTFRFHSATLQPGKRYWYYYIVDGYHVAHNPSVTYTTEPTTGRELNILDVPAETASTSNHKSSSSSHKSSSSSHKSSSSSSHKSSSSSSHKSSSSSSHKSSSSKSSSSRHHSSSSSSKDRHQRASLTLDIPKGRPLSVSQIKAPKPVSPNATRHILESDYYDNAALADLTEQLDVTHITDYYHESGDMTDFSLSPVSSTGSSFSWRSGSSSPNSSRSGYSTPGSDCNSCMCERYGITRRGERIKIDCGGSRCGYGDSASCSSDSDDEPVRHSRSSSRRHGIIVG
ncbi:hypothetical protein CDD82_6295 [Ophiocordyceps australis]|uniref:AMP-activated protein kinase glycogen-binding domain-containing protein n=1 Tax=Ophiocordyceps australis TaxID=1399860 RepID=A0A2C5YVS6_9HYPO|nr:hypothetical protein CDD82_6295 [Ophiocordyceps australis]